VPGAATPGEPHLGPVDFEYPLPHVAESLKHGRKTRIVAIGSSSTAGADGILPLPPRLEMTLREKFYGQWAVQSDRRRLAGAGSLKFAGVL
jgi:hypothetical protein